MPDYLNIFLNSKFGKKQIKRYSRRAVNQANVNAEELKLFRIATLPMSQQNVLKDLSDKSWSEIQKSKMFYTEANNLLLKELGLDNFEAKKKLFSVVNLSDCQKANRIDADFYQQKYFDLLSIILKNRSEKLKNIAKRISGNQKITQDQEFNYTEISDVDVLNGEVDSNKIIGKELPANAKIKVMGGELFISKVRPTRGAVAIVPECFSENHIVSGAFSVYLVGSPMREYLQVVLKSCIGKLQMERPTTGTSYPTITDQDVENLLIPILPKATQEKIADLVRKSHEARKKSKELLEEAKRKVEELIERG